MPPRWHCELVVIVRLETSGPSPAGRWAAATPVALAGSSITTRRRRQGKVQRDGAVPPAGGDGVFDLTSADREDAVIVEGAAQGFRSLEGVDERIPKVLWCTNSACSRVEEPCDVLGFVAGEYGFGEAGDGGVKAEPPRWARCQEFLTAWKATE